MKEAPQFHRPIEEATMSRNRAYGFLLLALALSACTPPREPLPITSAGGVEITLQTEAEYDKKVMRVRFKAN